MIEALQDANLKVWIDKPTETGLGYDRISQCDHLHSGDGFQEQIDAAIDGAACILVCWSQHAVQPGVIEGRERVVWLGEADAARRTKKLATCTIDAVNPANLPGSHATPHMICVRPDQPPEQLKGALEQLVADVKRKIEAWLVPKNTAAPAKRHASCLPYMANRTEQEVDANEAIHHSRQNGGVCPIFIVGPENEKPDEFFKRVGRSTPQFLPGGSRWYEIAIEWPGRYEPAQFTNTYRRLLWQALRLVGQRIEDEVIMTKLLGFDRPCVISHSLLAREWQTNEIERVLAWVGYWSDMARQCPQLQVVPWFQLKLPAAKPGWHDCPGGSSGGRVRNRDIWKAIVKDLADRIEGMCPGACVKTPSVLSPISIGDADRWAAKICCDSGPDHDAIDEAIRQVYAEPAAKKSGVCHQTFAKALEPFCDT